MHEEKLIARKKAAEEREKVRLAELEEHRKRVEAKAEEERKALIAQQQKKEERVNLWAAKEKEKQVRSAPRNSAQFSDAILCAMPLTRLPHTPHLAGQVPQRDEERRAARRPAAHRRRREGEGDGG